MAVKLRNFFQSIKTLWFFSGILKKKSMWFSSEGGGKMLNIGSSYPLS